MQDRYWVFNPFALSPYIDVQYQAGFLPLDPDVLVSSEWRIEATSGVVGDLLTLVNSMKAILGILSSRSLGGWNPESIKAVASVIAETREFKCI